MATKKAKPEPKLKKPVPQVPVSGTEKKLSCVCGHCEESHPRLSGYLLVALGALLLPLNMGLIPGLEFTIAWPILLVLIGTVLIVRATLCQSK